MGNVVLVPTGLRTVVVRRGLDELQETMTTKIEMDLSSLARCNSAMLSTHSFHIAGSCQTVVNEVSSSWINVSVLLQ